MPPLPQPNVPNQQRIFLPAIASGLLLYLAYFPLSLGFLAWFAMVPFLTLIRTDGKPRRLYLAAFVGGLAFYLPAIQWMRVAHPAMYATWLFLALYCSVFFPIGLWLMRIQDRAKIPLTIAVPAVVVGFEYFRAHFPSGFPFLEPLGIQHRIGFGWYFMGYSQHDFSTLIQIADIAGVYGVSLLVVLVNTTLFLWWCHWRTRTQARPMIGTFVAVGLILCSLCYGYARLDHAPFAAGPRVALLQGNVPQDVKMTQGQVLTKQYVDLWMKAVVDTDTPPDLTIWPETSVADEWIDKAPGIDAPRLPSFFATANERPKLDTALLQHFAEFQDSARNNSALMVLGGSGFGIVRGAMYWDRVRRPVLFGVNCIVMNANFAEARYNSAVLLSDAHAVDRYNKMHLVPFGEYVPLKTTLPFLKHFTPYENDYSCTPGKKWTRFPVQAKDRIYQFGCIICYEDSDPAIARRYAKPSLDGPAVDFMVNISNDGWFNGTPEHEEHLAICRFRAIETRRAIVRSVNMGISAIIDADGKIIALPADTWHASKKIEAVVTGTVPIDNRSSIYATTGDILPLLCWLVTLSGLILARRRRYHLASPAEA